MLVVVVMQGGSCSRCSRVQSVAGAGAGVRGPARPSHSAAPALGTARVPATPLTPPTLLTMAMPLHPDPAPGSPPAPGPTHHTMGTKYREPWSAAESAALSRRECGQTAVCSRRTGPRHRAGALSCVHLYLGHVTRDHVTRDRAQHADSNPSRRVSSKYLSKTFMTFWIS